MAFFKTIDFLKRNNAEILISIILQCGSMTLGKKSDGQSVNVENSIRLCDEERILTEDNFDVVVDDLKNHCETIKGLPPGILVNQNWFTITRFYKDSRFAPAPRNKNAPDVRDKEYQQRQEKKLVDIINSWNTPQKIENFRYKISSAAQAPDFGPHGKENLVDIVVFDEKNFSYNVSCKMTKAADLGSGGIAGLKSTVPQVLESLYTKTKEDLTGLGFRDGHEYHIKEIPSILYSLQYTHAYKIFRGSAALGGEIDYFYTGPEHVDYQDGKMNGNFWSIEKYAAKEKYYIRLRKKNIHNNMVKINFTKLNSYGLPCIFTSGAGDFVASRFIIDTRVPAGSIVREL